MGMFGDLIYGGTYPRGSGDYRIPADWNRDGLP